MKIVILIALAVMALLVLINGIGMLVIYFVSLVFPGLSVLQMWIFSGLLTIALLVLLTRIYGDTDEAMSPLITANIVLLVGLAIMKYGFHSGIPDQIATRYLPF